MVFNPENDLQMVAQGIHLQPVAGRLGAWGVSPPKPIYYTYNFTSYIVVFCILRLCTYVYMQKSWRKDPHS